MAAGYLKKAFDPVQLRRIALETYRVMRERDAGVIVGARVIRYRSRYSNGSAIRHSIRHSAET